MRPYTGRGSYISRVLSLREARGGLTARRGTHTVALAARDGTSVPGVVSVLSTWGLVAKVEAPLGGIPLRSVLGPEWRVVLDPATTPAEGRGTITSAEVIPGGFRIEIRLKSPLRLVPARPEE